MKQRQRIIADKLTHALTFMRLAKEAEWSELRKQHLNEAERLIEAVLGMEKDG